MEIIMNEENNWGHSVKGDAVEGLVGCVCRYEVFQVLNEMKSGTALGPSDA